jgi:hypothetical protein
MASLVLRARAVRQVCAFLVTKEGNPMVRKIDESSRANGEWIVPRLLIGS